MQDDNTPVELRKNTEFLKRLHDGDDSAFDQLAQVYTGSLIRYASVIVVSVDIAQDVVQDVLLNLWRNREKIREDWDIGAFLYGQTRHRAINIAQSNNSSTRREARWINERINDVDTTSTNGTAIFEGEEIRELISEALTEVSPRCREVFMLVWAEELPYLEIAHRLGLAEPTIRSYVSRAMAKIIEVLRPKYLE